jgi:hypothetical protein
METIRMVELHGPLEVDYAAGASVAGRSMSSFQTKLSYRALYSPTDSKVPDQVGVCEHTSNTSTSSFSSVMEEVQSESEHSSSHLKV